jgi:hypothetical protein
MRLLGLSGGAINCRIVSKMAVISLSCSSFAQQLRIEFLRPEQEIRITGLAAE